jgi:hypothetical protein
MNFKIVDGVRPDMNSIYDDFVADYVFSTELKNNEIRVKYGLTHGEFKQMCDMVKADFGLARRPIKIEGKYYYKHEHGYHIQKTIDCIVYYLGFVATEELAIEVVEKCKKCSWDIPVCRQIVKDCGGVCV